MEAVSISPEKAEHEHVSDLEMRHHKYVRQNVFVLGGGILCSTTPSFPPGAFMLLYVFLLVIVGIPLFFMELAAGQSIRQGSIGVWKHISPNLAGIGYSSCIVRVLMVFRVCGGGEWGGHF